LSLLIISFIYNAIKSPQEEPLDSQDDDDEDAIEDKGAKNLATYIVLSISLIFAIVYYYKVIKRFEEYQDYEKSKWSIDLHPENGTSFKTKEILEKDQNVKEESNLVK